ncbi:MAG: NAD-dependent deacylase [Pseudomonadales bacterium]|nr:NAD-dependent deacylase [Pseudomonadales bacterium]
MLEPKTTELTNDLIEKIQQAKQFLEQASRVACFSGAGLSADSGVATFRDSETHALWSQFDPMELASPEGFADNPRRVIDWYNWRREQLSNVEPNPGHTALAKQRDLVQITQNVDDLLERAGLDTKRILHLHGTITHDHCNHCGYSEAVELSQSPSYRFCKKCHQGEMRPSVVWFGESLPDEAWRQADQLCRNIDVLMVVGTNASVYPAAGLIEIAKRHGASVVIVNTQASDASHLADIELIGKSGVILPSLLEGLQLNSF